MKYLMILPVILLVACTKVEPQAAPPEPVKDATEQSALPADQK